MDSSSSAPGNDKTAQTIYLSPIFRELLREQHLACLQEQRNRMNSIIRELTYNIRDSNNRIENLMCVLASEKEERCYLESKLTENQTGHKEEMQNLTQGSSSRM